MMANIRGWRPHRRWPDACLFVFWCWFVCFVLVVPVVILMVVGTAFCDAAWATSRARQASVWQKGLTAGVSWWCCRRPRSSCVDVLLEAWNPVPSFVQDSPNRGQGSNIVVFDLFTN